MGFGYIFYLLYLKAHQNHVEKGHECIVLLKGKCKKQEKKKIVLPKQSTKAILEQEN